MMIWTISKSFEMSCAHQLCFLAEEKPDHKCARLHGHNYVIKVVLKCDRLSYENFVVDYAELDWFKRMIDEEFDHRHLNDVLGDPSGACTTAENLAQLFFRKVKHWIDTHELTDEAGETWPSGIRDHVWCEQVEVSETPKTNAIYSER